MKKLINLLLYAGADPQEFQAVRTQMHKANRRDLIIFSVIACVAFAAMFIVACLDPTVMKNAWLYASEFVVNLVICYLASFTAKEKPGIITPLMYFFLASVLLFGIGLTTIHPNELTVSYIILLFAVPLFFTGAPIFTIAIILLSLVPYFVLGAHVQPEEIFHENLTTVIPYSLLSLIICAYLMRIKVGQFILEHRNRLLIETDQLTGLYNRRSYEEKMAALENAGTPVVICALDVNGLKIVNDSHGHAAGDELICGAADCIREVFAPYGDCFRTGGDEFVALLTHDVPAADELSKAFDACTAAWHGTHLSAISVSLGLAEANDEVPLRQAAAIADARMYGAKEQHYRETGWARR